MPLRRKERMATLDTSAAFSNSSPKKYAFAFVSNSAEIAEAVKRCSDPNTEIITVRLATMEEAVPVARQLLSTGAEVILGGGGTGSLLMKTIGQPIIKIARTHLDILNALKHAKKFGSHIGLTSFASPVTGIEIFEELLAIKIRQIIFNTTEELKNGIHKAVTEGITCLVGGGICKKIISGFGKHGIVVPPSNEVILDALHEARALAEARRKEQEDTEQLKTILETIKEGVIVIDTGGKVKIFNHMASDIFGLALHKGVGLPLPSVMKGTGLIKVLDTGEPELENIRRVGNVDIVINSLPIIVNGRPCGAVATFKEATRIQDIDRKLREKRYQKGFVARYRIEQIKTQSEKMKQLLHKTVVFAETDETICIVGETGTGKELLAQSIHQLSRRRENAFVAINCAALPESLLESELFGYEEGAFTGAKKGGKIGLFELADGGTIFLDEIADISQSLQTRLLRVLEEKEVMRVGGDRIVPVDIRIICSTYKDLAAEVRTGKFRRDLFYRLAVLKLHIPPLRNRLEDIPIIVESLLTKHGKRDKRISPKMIERLKQYHWPGNVRELDSLIKAYGILVGRKVSDDSLLTELLEGLMHEDGVDSGRTDRIPPGSPVSASGRPLKEMVEDYEKEIIKKALQDCCFRKNEAAKRLGISINTLWRKLQPQANISSRSLNSR